MSAELSRRALEAREAAEVLTRIESRQDSPYTMEEVAVDRGLTLE